MNRELKNHVVPEERLQKVEAKLKDMQQQSDSKNGHIDLTSDDTDQTESPADGSEQTSSVNNGDQQNDPSEDERKRNSDHSSDDERKRNSDQKSDTGEFTLERERDTTSVLEKEGCSFDDESIKVQELKRNDGTHDLYWPHLERCVRVPVKGTWVLVEQGWVQVMRIFPYDDNYQFHAKFDGGKAQSTYHMDEIQQFSVEKPRFADTNITKTSTTRGRSREKKTTSGKQVLKPGLDFMLRKKRGASE